MINLLTTTLIYWSTLFHIPERMGTFSNYLFCPLIVKKPIIFTYMQAAGTRMCVVCASCCLITCTLTEIDFRALMIIQKSYPEFLKSLPSLKYLNLKYLKYLFAKFDLMPVAIVVCLRESLSEQSKTFLFSCHIHFIMRHCEEWGLSVSTLRPLRPAADSLTRKASCRSF